MYFSHRSDQGRVIKRQLKVLLVQKKLYRATLIKTPYYLEKRWGFLCNFLKSNFSLCQQAKVIVYEGSVAKKDFLFDATGTDKLNWFSEGKLISSSWTDIKTEPRNYFSIQGDSPRNFYINRNYGGCDKDAGWLVAGAGIHCSWETSAAHKNKVLYSKLPTYANWNSNGEAHLLFWSILISQGFLPGGTPMYKVNEYVQLWKVFRFSGS